MRRREFMVLLGCAAAAWPLAAGAQQVDRMRRIGVLMTTAADDPESPGPPRRVREGIEGIGLDRWPQCPIRLPFWRRRCHHS